MSEDRVQSEPVCLLTRPAHQNQQLRDWLTEDGFEVLAFPTIAITAAPTTEALARLAQRIHDYDIAIFVSRNAADYAFQHINPAKLPDKLELAVIGSATLRAVQAHGLQSQILPAASYNSEGLLAAPGLQQVAGKRIVIFRGQAGRNLLGDTLLARGATVDYYEVYRRVVPDYSPQVFSDLVGARFPDIAVFTSAEGLHNAVLLVAQQEWHALCAIPWLLISERMRETALDLGHNGPITIAKNASDEGIRESLNAWRFRDPDHHP
jgi:uroporphyrinogen-III synthase